MEHMVRDKVKSKGTKKALQDELLMASMMKKNMPAGKMQTMMKQKMKKA